ncbi:MAG: Protein of unknown function precursor containing a C-terminal secretion signal [Verrucomicrobiales bacterium]|nr:Protein of unknown function precursor containing a C-terminal secretion signal [Verrucomicrobiales bacterium]
MRPCNLLLAFMLSLLTASAEVRLLCGDANNNIHGKDGALSDISADGKLVLFASGPPTVGTTPGITQGGLYIRDLVANTLTFTGSTNVGGEGTFSDDGRYVAWTTPQSTLCWRDRQNDIIRAITPNADGSCRNPQMSANGRYVAYASNARNLVTSTNLLPPPGGISVYLYDSLTDTTTLVSLTHNGQALLTGIPAATEFDLSADGHYVVFSSTSTNAPNPAVAKNAGWVWSYRRDLGTGQLDIIGKSVSNTIPTGNFSAPHVNANGNRIAFTSGFLAGSIMTNGYFSTGFDLYMKDMTSGRVWWVTKTTNNAATAGANYTGTAINAAGTVVAFASSGTQLVPEETDPAPQSDVFDVFRCDINASGTVSNSLITKAEFGTNNVGLFSGPYLPGTGKYVAFNSRYLHSLLNTNTDSSLYSFGIGSGVFPTAGDVSFGLSTDVSPASSGSITVDPFDTTFASNTVVTLTAVPAGGKQFVGWSGDASGSVNPIQVTMNSAKSVTAIFTNFVFVPTYTLTTNVSPAGSGSINVDPSGTTFASNSVVNLTATPVAGKMFVKWTGAVTTNANPLSITMSANKSVTAVFTNAPLFYVLTTNVSPQGLGTISASPAPATNGYASGTIVTLTATPNSGVKFVKWTGASIALTNRIKVTMTANKTVTAVFTNIAKFALNLTLSPANAGMVIKSPAPVSGNDYYTGTVVTLTPVANTGFKFVKWTGSLIGTANPAKVTMTANKTIVAVFTNVPTFLLSASVNPPGAGDILASPSPATNGYSSNTVVTLTAVANDTNQFVGWSGLTSFSNAVNVKMNGNKTVSAIFNTPGKVYWQSTNSVISLWFMQSSNYIGSTLLNNGIVISKAWRLAGTVDFDNNGSQDLLFQNTSGAVMLWMMTNNFIVRTQALKAAPVSLRLVGAGNFTTNTSPDLVWQNNSTGALSLYTFKGTNYSGAPLITSSIAPGTTWKAIAVADFNHDGNSDIVFQHTDGRVMLWFMTGSTMTSSVILNDGLAATTGWKVAGISDLDDNGTPDILFQVTGGKSGVWALDGTNKLSENFLAEGGTMPAAWTLRAGK